MLLSINYIEVIQEGKLMFISNELQKALEYAQKKHHKIYFDKFLVRLFIGKITELKKQMEFMQARNRALRDCGIWNKEVRAAYKSLASSYFGRRGGLKSAQNRKNKRKRNKKSIPLQKVLIDENGQYEFTEFDT